MRDNLDTLTKILVHPESPFVLTKNGAPEKSVIQKEKNALKSFSLFQAHLKFDNL